MSDITMPAFSGLINEIEDARAWENFAEPMLNMLDAHVRRVASEMDNKRANAPKEYGAILGTIYQNIGFLSDPLIRETLSGGDVSMEVLCKQDCNIYIIIPAEYLAQVAPMTRSLIGSSMIHKGRHPSAPRVLYLVDEAAQLGRFDTLVRAYSYGRGMGIRTWSFWQNIDQIATNYGRDAVSTFMASSQCRQFLPPRDLATADMLSRMLGMQTLEYDAELEQAAARRNKAHIIRELMNGADPLELGLNYGQQAKAAVSRTKQARELLTRDEILNMPDDMQLLFISGVGLSGALVNKYPYYTRHEMRGAYLENPHHSQRGRVPIAGRFWSKSARIITERVPSHLAHWPQYQSGEISYVEGYRPY